MACACVYFRSTPTSSPVFLRTSLVCAAAAAFSLHSWITSLIQPITTATSTWLVARFSSFFSTHFIECPREYAAPHTWFVVIHILFIAFSSLRCRHFSLHTQVFHEWDRNTLFFFVGIFVVPPGPAIVCPMPWKEIYRLRKAEAAFHSVDKMYLI